ncbi:hypothetical protein B0H16DRAFT_827880 [Mycena metata]|uniref:Uncharacterized protein n=1 Tax=Mycena metata TaxID=1033252 RepID=A0AAD7GP63_9AGAR|nr:hypothetical protein B0H16DRAFT_827880 [Mycena metata]
MRTAGPRRNPRRASSSTRPDSKYYTPASIGFKALECFSPRSTHVSLFLYHEQRGHSPRARPRRVRPPRDAQTLRVFLRAAEQRRKPHGCRRRGLEGMRRLGHPVITRTAIVRVSHDIAPSPMRDATRASLLHSPASSSLGLALAQHGATRLLSHSRDDLHSHSRTPHSRSRTRTPTRTHRHAHACKDAAPHARAHWYAHAHPHSHRGPINLRRPSSPSSSALVFIPTRLLPSAFSNGRVVV